VSDNEELAPVTSLRFVTEPVVGAGITFHPLKVLGAPKSRRNLRSPVVVELTVVYADWPAALVDLIL
jgi:hypothetical protein